MLLRGTASHTGCGVLRPWSSRPPAVAGRTICRRQRQPLSVMSGQPRWGNCTLPTQHAIARGSKNAPNHFCFQHGRVIAGYRFCPAPRVAVLVGRGISRSLSAGGARIVRRRGDAGRRANLKDSNRKVAIYMTAIVTAVLGISYAAVPLYKVFCQVTGFGGTTQVADADKAKKMTPVDGGRLIRVTFDGGCSDTMPWHFRPTQGDVKVVPGETALAFFTARNPTRKHITGVATYNVFPPKAGIYFNKIQCFCFEEQRLRAGEEIDMPVFFFLDPDMLDDPAMDNVNNVTLSYTFFQTAEEIIDEEDEDI